VTQSPPPAPDDERPEGHQPEAVRATITLLQRRGIEAEVLIPLIRRMEQEFGRDAAHRIARETIESIARDQGHAVAEALQRRDLEGFHHVKDTWSGAGGDLQITTLREDAEALEFNVTGCRFADMYRRMGAEDLGFILSCSRDFALSEGYSDALHLERRQTIMQGAPFCDFRYRLAANRAQGEAAAGDAAPPPPASEPAPEPPPEASAEATAQAQEQTDAERLGEQAARVGGILGRMAKSLAARAKPEVELRARQARAAAEAARPHVERAAQQAKEYVQTHDEQIIRAAETGARFAADRVIPPAIRPLVDAAERELRRPAPLRDDAPPPPADSAPTDSAPTDEDASRRP
jgi:hypothetical protein